MQLKVNRIRNRTESKGLLGGSKTAIKYGLRLRLELTPEEKETMETWGPDTWTMAEWKTGLEANPDEHSLSLRDVLRGCDITVDTPEFGEFLIGEVVEGAKNFKKCLEIRAKYDDEVIFDI